MSQIKTTDMKFMPVISQFHNCNNTQRNEETGYLREIGLKRLIKTSLTNTKLLKS